MPRPRVFKSRAFIGLIIEPEVEEVLRRIASQEGVSVSELVRHIIREWLESVAVTRYGLNLVFESPKSDKASKDPAPSDPVEELELRDLEASLEYQKRMN